LTWLIEIYKTCLGRLYGSFLGSRCLIDIPIGFPEGKEERLCDIKARKFIKPRGSSVFPVPCKEAVYADDDKRANEINRQVRGKGLSKQSLAIRFKIREVDEFLNRHPDLLKESHPEVCFKAFAEDETIQSKHSHDGWIQRLRIISEQIPPLVGSFKKIREQYLKSTVKGSDIMDAMIMAIAAWKAEGMNYTTFPEQEESCNIHYSGG